MKKFLALLLTVAMVFAMAACSAPAAEETKPAEEGTAAPAEETSDKPAAAGSVYYLNFKPEADAAWQELAKKYTELTGVPVKVVTAASGDPYLLLLRYFTSTNIRYPSFDTIRSISPDATQ